MKTQFSKLILMLFAILQLFHFGFAEDIIQTSCKEATNTDPRIDYKLCIKRLKSNLDSKDATLEELVLISIEQSKAVVEQIQTAITNLLHGRARWGVDGFICHKGCVERYSEAASHLNSAMEAVKVGDYETAKTEVNAAMDASQNCGIECKEKGIELSGLTKFNDYFLPFVATSLAFVNMAH